jgi:hypothetical protein
MTKRCGAAATALLIMGFALGGPASGAESTVTSFGTYRFWDKGTGMGTFDAGSGAQTLGQTITAPVDGALSKFVFWVKSDPAVKFRGYVYQWDPVAQRATGPVLWSGGVRHTKDSVSFEKVVFVPQSVPVASGTSYVVFMSTLGIPQHGSGGIVGQENREGQCNFYDDGVAVLDDGATSPSEWSSTKWDYGDGICAGANFQPGGDLVFRVSLTS